MIPDFKTYISESVWNDIRRRGNGTDVKKEDDIDLLKFDDFAEYLDNAYESPYKINQHYIGSSTDGIAVISIPIEMNDHNETPNFGNRMLKLRYDLAEKEFDAILPNTYVFRLYPNELRKTFCDKYELEVSPGAEGKIIPKDGKITNRVCVDVLDKLIGMVENPILKKKI